MLLLLAAYLALCSVGVAYFALFVSPALGWAAAGALLCALVFFARDAVANRRVRELVDGDLGEQFTSDEVRKLRRRGWRIVDRVEFERSDVDHVIIGPAGVFAVETKWTNWAWTMEGGRFTNQWAARAVAQCRKNRNRIHHLLKGNFGITLEVVPVLVVWGEGRPRLDSPTVIDGVVVLDGHLLRSYLRGLPEQLHATSIRTACAAVERFVQERETHAASVPRSLAAPRGNWATP